MRYCEEEVPIDTVMRFALDSSMRSRDVLLRVRADLVFSDLHALGGADNFFRRERDARVLERADAAFRCVASTEHVVRLPVSEDGRFTG